MQTTVFTTQPAFQVVLPGKNQVTILVNVVIYVFYQVNFHKWLVKDLYKNVIAKMLFQIIAIPM